MCVKLLRRSGLVWCLTRISTQSVRGCSLFSCRFYCAGAARFSYISDGPLREEGELTAQPLVASRRRITVFLCSVLVLILVFGSLMFLVKGGTNPQGSSIP